MTQGHRTGSIILLDEPDDDMLELDYEIYDDESNDLDLDYTTQQ